MPAPRGKAISKAKINFWTIVLQSVTKRAMPAPRGKPLSKAVIENLNGLQQSVTNETGNARLGGRRYVRKTKGCFENAPKKSVFSKQSCRFVLIRALPIARVYNNTLDDKKPCYRNQTGTLCSFLAFSCRPCKTLPRLLPAEVVSL